MAFARRTTQHDAAFLSKAAPPTSITADGALVISEDGTYLLSKTSALALSVAAPGAINVGRRIRLIVGTDFAHVVTFTGSTLRDGTTGAKITWTTVAFTGCSLEIVAITALLWAVQSKNLGTVA